MSLKSYQLKTLLDKVLNQTGEFRKGETELKYFCPFGCKPDKRKLEISVEGNAEGSFHCWICNFRGRNFRSLFYKLKVKKSYFDELYKIIGKTWKYSEPTIPKIDLSLPEEFVPLWEKNNSFEYGNSLSYLQKTAPRRRARARDRPVHLRQADAGDHQHALIGSPINPVSRSRIASAAVFAGLLLSARLSFSPSRPPPPPTAAAARGCPR